MIEACINNHYAILSSGVISNMKWQHREQWDHIQGKGGVRWSRIYEA